MPGHVKRDGWVVPEELTIVDISEDDDLTQGVIDIRTAAFGGIAVPATHNGTSIGFVTAAYEEGPFVVLNNAANAAIVIVTSDATAGNYPLPPELFAWNYCKISPGQQSTTDTQYTVVLRA